MFFKRNIEQKVSFRKGWNRLPQKIVSFPEMYMVIVKNFLDFCFWGKIEKMGLGGGGFGDAVCSITVFFAGFACEW